MAVQNVGGTSNLSMQFQEQALLAFNSTFNYPANMPFTSPAWANTTGGALGLDTLYAHQYTLVSTTATINLFDGSLLSPGGNACVFNRVRFFAVGVVTTAAGKLINVQSGASSGVLWLPPAANTLFIPSNNSLFVMADPMSITTNGFIVDTSHKNITFDSVSNTVAFNVLIVGNSSAS